MELAPRSSRWRRLLIKAVSIPPLVYLFVIAFAWLLEDRLVFVPTTAAHGWVFHEELKTQNVALTLADGTPIHAWWCPKEAATRTVLYCHGNGGNVSFRATTYWNLQQEQNVSVLAVDYPGFGKSAGRANETTCCESAQVAYDWLVKQGGIAPERIILFGESLGGGVVTELATRRPCRAIVLMSTFTTIRDAAQEMYPILPCRWLMRTKFDNLAKLRSLTCPVFLAHGDADTLISPSHARKLQDAARGPTALYLEPGGGHDLEPTPAFHAALREFLARNESSHDEPINPTGR